MMDSFEKRKIKFIKRLREEKEKGIFDEKITNIVELINSQRDMFTTSSCSGRITVCEKTIDENKKMHRFLGKWHEKVDVESVKMCMKKHKKNYLYFTFDPFILHVTCKKFNTATKLLNVAIEFGFKHSGILSSKRFFVVEIIGTDYLAVPLAYNGRFFVNSEYIDFLVSIVNNKMERNDKRVNNFFITLSSLFNITAHEINVPP